MPPKGRKPAKKREDKERIEILTFSIVNGKGNKIKKITKKDEIELSSQVAKMVLNQLEDGHIIDAQVDGSTYILSIGMNHDEELSKDEIGEAIEDTVEAQDDRKIFLKYTKDKSTTVSAPRRKSSPSKAKKTLPRTTPQKNNKKGSYSTFKPKPFTTTVDEDKMSFEVNPKDFKKLANLLSMPDSFQKHEDFLALARRIVSAHPEYASIPTFGAILKTCIEEYVKGEIISHKGKIYLLMDAEEIFKSGWKETTLLETYPRDNIIASFSERVGRLKY